MAKLLSGGAFYYRMRGVDAGAVPCPLSSILFLAKDNGISFDSIRI